MKLFKYHSSCPISVLLIWWFDVKILLSCSSQTAVYFPSSHFKFSSYLDSVGTAGWGRRTREKAALTSEIKNPFTLLSHPFGGWPKEKQLLGWQWRRETDRERERERKWIPEKEREFLKGQDHALFPLNASSGIGSFQKKPPNKNFLCTRLI